jgi:hypothetical protein
MNQSHGPFLAEITPLFVAGPAKMNAIPLAAFLGEMHKILGGVLALHSIISPLLIGIWSIRAEIFPGFGLCNWCGHTVAGAASF